LGESIFGGQAADHLTKVTVVLASLFLGLTLLLAVITGRRPLDKGVVEKEALKTPKTVEMLPATSKEKTGEKASAEALGEASKDAKSAESAAVKVVEGAVSTAKSADKPAAGAVDKETGKANDKKASAPEK
jgi:preprotein translocase subunit SecG